MRTIVAIAGLVFLAAVQPAVAAESAALSPKKEEAAPGTSVDMPYLIAPLSSGETLEAYAYISCRIIGTSQDAALQIREKVPFIQDAFVRDVNVSGVGKPGDPTSVDNAILAVRLLALTKEVMGPGKVADLKIIQVQISQISPKADVSNGSP